MKVDFWPSSPGRCRACQSAVKRWYRIHNTLSLLFISFQLNAWYYHLISCASIMTYSFLCFSSSAAFRVSSRLRCILTISQMAFDSYSFCSIRGGLLTITVQITAVTNHESEIPSLSQKVHFQIEITFSVLIFVSLSPIIHFQWSGWKIWTTELWSHDDPFSHLVYWAIFLSFPSDARRREFDGCPHVEGWRYRLKCAFCAPALIGFATIEG